MKMILPLLLLLLQSGYDTAVTTSSILTDNIALTDVCTGDLGNDGTNNIVLVMEYPLSEEEAEFWFYDRILYLFTENPDHSYTCTQQNKNIVLSHDSGGIYGDPYAGITITEEGELTVSNYGGSSGRWGYTYTFVSVDGKLLLSKMVEEESSTHTANGIITTYDLLKGTVITEAVSFWDESFIPLCIYQGSFPPQTIRLEDASYSSVLSLDASPAPKYRSYSCFGYYDYYCGENADNIHNPAGRLQYSAQEVLDQIHAEYYPHFKRIPVPVDEEILKNISILCGYEVPRYYYADDTHTLEYSKLENYEESPDEWVHIVTCYDTSEHETQTYEVLNSKK